MLLNFVRLLEEGEKSIIDKLRGKILISSYPSQDEQKLVNLASMKLLMRPEKQLEFNSKTRLRAKASHYGYKVSPGIEIYSLNELDKKIIQLEKIIRDFGLNINTVKIWSKFDAQNDGKGTISFIDLNENTINNLKRHLDSFSDASKLFPIVIEVDVNCLKDIKVVGNMGVEAIIADSAITIIGSVMQDTFNGRYIGSIIAPESEKYEFVAESAAIPAFVGMQKEGYRGVATIDILVAYNSKSRSYIGYNIDPNARFSAGMQLLSIIQYIRKITGEKYYGISRFNSVKDSNNLFQGIKDYAAPYLYEGGENRYEGIIPVLVNDLTKTEDNKRVVQVVVIGKNMQTIDKMYKHFKDNIVKALSFVSSG